MLVYLAGTGPLVGSLSVFSSHRDAVNASPDLQAKFTAGEDWVEIAQVAGHEIMAAEIEVYAAVRPNDQLFDFELEVFTGGSSQDRRDMTR
ncbi:MAG: hypothetical protein VX346_03440 [Planctomycetota bacterium]|nr:hypothetical protein [Planctomycetota bacterium]